METKVYIRKYLNLTVVNFCCHSLAEFEPQQRGQPAEPGEFLACLVFLAYYNNLGFHVLGFFEQRLEFFAFFNQQTIKQQQGFHSPGIQRVIHFLDSIGRFPALPADFSNKFFNQFRFLGKTRLQQDLVERILV